MAIFYFARHVRKLALYSDVIHLFDWKVQSMDDNCGDWVECMGVASGLFDTCTSVSLAVGIRIGLYVSLHICLCAFCFSIVCFCLSIMHCIGLGAKQCLALCRNF